MAQSLLSPCHAIVAEVTSTLGDGSHGGLVSEGFYASLFYNDWIGKTDKYLTHASKLGYLRPVSTDSSVNLQLAWRVLNPGFRPKFSSPNALNPPGVFADWIDLQIAFHQKVSESISMQFELGLGHLKNHFAKEVHRQFHKIIDTTYDHLTYKDSLEGWTGSGAFNLKFQTSLLHYLNIEFSLGSKVDYFFWQAFSQLSLEWDGKFNIPVSFQVRHFHRLHEFIFENAMRDSVEYSLKIKVLGFWVPSINYVSRQFKDDPIGQYYFDFASFVW